jgi:hypothetical protein
MLKGDRERLVEEILVLGSGDGEWYKMGVPFFKAYEEQCTSWFIILRCSPDISNETCYVFTVTRNYKDASKPRLPQFTLKKERKSLTLVTNDISAKNCEVHTVVAEHGKNVNDFILWMEFCDRYPPLAPASSSNGDALEILLGFLRYVDIQLNKQIGGKDVPISVRKKYIHNTFLGMIKSNYRYVRRPKT